MKYQVILNSGLKILTQAETQIEAAGNAVRFGVKAERIWRVEEL